MNATYTNHDPDFLRRTADDEEEGTGAHAVLPPEPTVDGTLTVMAAARLMADRGLGFSAALVDGKLWVTTYALPTEDDVPAFLRPQGE